MHMRRKLLPFGVVCLVAASCEDNVHIEPPEDVVVGDRVDASTPTGPDAGPTVVDTCRPAQGQAGPARAAIMVEGAGGGVETPADLLGVEKVYEGFQTFCAVCHSAVPMGMLTVTSLETFKMRVTEESVLRLKSTDPTKVMPQGQSKFLEQREPMDPLVVFAKRLEAWLAAGKPDSFVDPTTVMNEPEPNLPPAPVASAFALSKELGGALTNMGSCIPAKEVVSSAAEPMDRLDALFAQAARFEDLPTKLSETDLFTLDSLKLAEQGVISFAPAYTLWADDAHKMRYVRAPRGQSIQFSVATQSFEIPENARFYKTFLKEVRDLEGNVGYRKMETRIIVARKATEQPGDPLPKINALYGSYAWNEEETEATLVTEPYKDGTPFADTTTEYVKDEAHYAFLQAEGNEFIDYFKEGAKRHYAIPGGDRCVQCHMGHPSFVLGFLPLQIMRRPMGEGGVIEPAEPDELNQLERLIDYGLVTGLAKDEIKRRIVPLEKSQGDRLPRNNAELEAQGYMLGNCAHCHNPNGYPSRTASALRDVLDLMPSPRGGGIFQFPLERVSPRIRRTVKVGATEDDVKSEVIEVPYITTSLYDLGGRGTAPYSWSEYQAPTPLPSLAPWRSLLFRNVQSGFTYSDTTTLYPHMPLHTAGFDCRAPKLMAEWMLSIPSIDRDAATAYVTPAQDLRAQPHVEIRSTDPLFAEARRQVEDRLAFYRADTTVQDCRTSPDIIDANAETPAKWSRSVLQTLNNPDFFPLHIPNRSHWAKLDTRAEAGKWVPRGSWQRSLVQEDVSDYGSEDLQEEQRRLIGLLKQRQIDAAFRQFALTEVPFGLWREKPGCKFDGIPTAGSYVKSPDWSWLKLSGSEPLYMQSPGGAIFGMVCVNCHGATFEANGRQATVVADMTGGRSNVANFRDGMFGPRAAPGQSRQEVFAEIVTPMDTVDDWSARYMAWMALGGTRAAIPNAVLQVVGDNPVLGESVQRGVTASANMLELAKVVCEAVLPSRAAAHTAGYRYSRRNGDYDLWRRVCGYENPVPVRAFFINQDQVLSLDNDKTKVSYPTVQLFRRDASEYANADFYDGYDGTLKTGLAPTVIEPECILPRLDLDADELDAFRRAYDVASGNPARRPLCPPAIAALRPDLMISEAEEKTWPLRGAVNAGFAVFAFIDASTRGEVTPKPEYDQCEKLSATAP